MQNQHAYCRMDQENQNYPQARHCSYPTWASHNWCYHYWAASIWNLKNLKDRWRENIFLTQNIIKFAEDTRIEWVIKKKTKQSSRGMANVVFLRERRKVDANWSRRIAFWMKWFIAFPVFCLLIVKLGEARKRLKQVSKKNKNREKFVIIKTYAWKFFVLGDRLNLRHWQNNDSLPR